MSTSELGRNDDPLDPVKIREDILPAAQAVEDGRLRNASLLKRGLVASLVLMSIGLLTPIFVPLDERPTEIAFINSDEVIIYTDPPGAKIKIDSLSADGSPLGTSSTDPIVIDQIFGQEKDNAILLMEMKGYNTVRQLLTPMDTGNKIWPQHHQPVQRLSAQNPLIYLFDYLPRYRPLLFACFCLGAAAAGVLGLALRRHAKWLAQRETIRQKEKSQDNLTCLSVLGYEVVERRGAGATW